MCIELGLGVQRLSTFVLRHGWCLSRNIVKVSKLPSRKVPLTPSLLNFMIYLYSIYNIILKLFTIKN